MPILGVLRPIRQQKKILVFATLSPLTTEVIESSSSQVLECDLVSLPVVDHSIFPDYECSRGGRSDGRAGNRPVEPSGHRADNGSPCVAAVARRTDANATL